MSQNLSNFITVKLINFKDWKNKKTRHLVAKQPELTVVH